MKDKQVEDAQRLFEVLFPHLDGKNRIEIRLLRPGKGRETEERGFGDDIDSTLEYALETSTECTLEAYFGVAARGFKAMGKKHNLMYTATLHADVDVGKGKYWKSKEQALAELDAFDPPPSAVVDSGGGLHAYWFLTKPVVFGEAYSLWRCREKCDGCQQKRSGRCKTCRVCSAWKHPTHIPAEMDKVEGVMRSFVDILHLDPGTWDATRILRIPGTANNKPGKDPRPVQLLYLHPDRRYALEPLVRQYYIPRPDENEDDSVERFFPGNVPDAKKAWARLKKETARVLTPGKAGSLTSMVETGDARRFIKNDGSAGDRSRRDLSAALKLLECGATHGEMLAIWQHFPIGDRFRESGSRGRRYLKNRIQRAALILSERDPTLVTPKPPPRHIDFNWWVWNEALPKTRKVLRALPGTYRTLIDATGFKNRRTIKKWLDLAIALGWAVEENTKKATGGKPAMVFARTDDGPWGVLMKGRHWLALKRSAAARALYQATNKTPLPARDEEVASPAAV